MRYAALAMLILALAFCAPTFAEFKAAVAVRIVTPDPLLPVTGGAGGTEPADKKVGEITVRALVIDRDGTRLAIASGDFLGYPGILCDKVRALVKGVSADNIIIGATHAHSAPDLYGFPNPDGTCHADLKYIDSVVARTADAINEAVSKLKPAAVKIATDEAQGRIAYNYYAEQLFDPRMNVVQIVGKKGKPICTLVNYASHPEVIGDGKRICSPDFPGAMYEHIEKLGGGTGIYMNSAQGGMVTADNRGPSGKEDIGTWEECVRLGNLMAEEAMRIVKDAKLQENPELLVKAEKVQFPLESERLLAVVQKSPLGNRLTPDNKVTTQINLINLGNAQILTIPGEALPNVGSYLKRKMHGQCNLLFGLTNDAFGYMMAKEDFGAFKRYKYISETSLGEQTVGILEENALRMVNEAPAPKPVQ